VRAAGVLAKGCMRTAGRMFDMPGLTPTIGPSYIQCITKLLVARVILLNPHVKYFHSYVFRVYVSPSELLFLSRQIKRHTSDK
jgi:hypothetical protein